MLRKNKCHWKVLSKWLQKTWKLNFWRFSKCFYSPLAHCKLFLYIVADSLPLHVNPSVDTWRKHNLPMHRSRTQKMDGDVSLTWLQFNILGLVYRRRWKKGPSIKEMYIYIYKISNRYCEPFPFQKYSGCWDL